MGDLNLVLYISFAAPLLMSLFVCRGRAGTQLLFLWVGMTVCLFCGEFNGVMLRLFPCDTVTFTSNYTPLFEEFFKSLPVLVYAFLFKPDRRTLLECSALLGVGFAVQENAFVLAGSAGAIPLSHALIRGFGAGVMHALCTLTVGYGMSFVHVRRKLFYTGTAALLTAAVIYHSVYNTLVQSPHRFAGFLLPVLTFLPVLSLMNRTAEE